MATFILIAIFAHGYGPSANYVNIGEFYNLAACQSAAAAVRKAGNDLDLVGHQNAKFVCAKKN